VYRMLNHNKNWSQSIRYSNHIQPGEKGSLMVRFFMHV
jgi:hypothetical protein